MDNAETKLAQSQREDDTLTNLQTALENCTLTATMDGTITALNATVGAVCSGTVATIQDVDNLTVEVTIPASSVGRLKTGLQCNITSDATDDTVTGTLTRIDPVANDSGSFGATVTVNGQDSGLLVGIPAKVEIVISTKDNVFTVPRDAVGTNDDGSTYVLRKTGGEGVDMTFEQVAVTEGDTNDYYVEITGSDLNEGDVIRATADLTQGIESGTSDSDVQMMENGDLYVGDGSNMPEAPSSWAVPAAAREVNNAGKNTTVCAEYCQELIGKEAAHPAQPLIQMQGIRKSYYIGQPNELEILHGIDLTVYPASSSPSWASPAPVSPR